MSNGFEYVYININIDKEELYISEKATLKIKIINKSDFKVENGLFRLIVDTDIFSIIDEKYQVCINDFGSIQCIDPGKNIEFYIPIKVKSTPNKLQTSISAYMNFHIVDNGDLIDLNCTSKDLLINFLDINKITEKDFQIISIKDQYIFDEDIDFTIKIKNNGNYLLKNIKLSNYIPENTYILENSIQSSNYENIVLTNNDIIITNLAKDDEIIIDYKVITTENLKEPFIIANPKISYDVKDNKKIEVYAYPLELKINKNYIFDKESFKYQIDKEKVFDNDIITHTITISNPTNINITNAVLIPQFNSKINFVKNSLIINDIYRVNEDINNPVNIGYIDSKEEVKIVFKSKILSKDKDGELFFGLEYKTNKRKLTQNSNIIKYDVLRAIFSKDSFIKYTNKENYNLREIIEYTIEIMNVGNAVASNVVLSDELIQNIEFINTSLCIDGIKVESEKNIEKLYLGNLDPNQKKVINYKAKAIDICDYKKSSSYITYHVDNQNHSLMAYSNEVNIKIKGARIGNHNIKKELSSYTAQIGDIITARLIIENTGNVDCENLKITEPVNSALELIEKSIYINNILREDEDILRGINIPKIKPKEIITISYQMKVFDFPKPNPVADKSILTYCFINHENKIETNTVYSSKAKLYVNNPSLHINDNHACNHNSVLTKFCHYGDYIFYNLVIENQGNVGLEDITLDFNFPKDLVLDKRTLKINNCIFNKNFDKTVHLPNLNVSQKIFIEFYVKHSFQGSYDIESFLYFEYVFRDFQNKIPFRKSKKFKENIAIINPDIEITKFVLDKNIDVDMEFTKNINIKNTGNILLENIKVNLNEGEFLRNSISSIFLNGVHVPRSDILEIKKLKINETINIAIRYKLVDIPLCESLLPESEVLAEYKFNNDKPILIRRKSDTLKLDIKNYRISIKGKSSIDTLMLNTKSAYVFNIINNGNVDCDFIKLNINLPECIEYVTDSMNLNGKRVNIRTISSPIDIGCLKCNESANISFEFFISSMPFKQSTSINGILHAKYNIGENIINRSFQSLDTNLNIEQLCVDIIKVPSQDYLQSGDILSIQNIINNTGTIDICNLILKDNTESNLVFVEDSVYINGQNIVEANPVTGIYIEELNALEDILITYEYEYIPKVCSNKIVHFSELEYCYYTKDKEEKNINLKSDTLYIEGALSTFKQFSMENEYILKEYEPDICDVTNVFCDAKIESFYEIESIKNKSYDNFNATGKKVIIKGFVMDRVEYLIKTENASLYMLERIEPFTIFLNLPSDYNNEDIYFIAKCDNVFYQTMGHRGVFISKLISIEGVL